MKAILTDLLQLLSLERLDTNHFRGESRDIGARRVFGGQVLGQALTAASATTEGLVVHSLHAYFLRKGDHGASILYEVDRQRDGRSFSSRRVVAIQHGRPILNLAASFQRPEEGLEHQVPMPDVPPPEELEDMAALRQQLLARVPASKLPRYLLQERPIEFRPVQRPQFLDPRPAEPSFQVWFRAVDRLPDEPDLHRAILAYASDYNLITTATRPHGLSYLEPNFQIASLDHAMWFQRPFRADEWMLYAIDSPTATGARALCRGMIFRRNGSLAAVVAQEGLMRIWQPSEQSED